MMARWIWWHGVMAGVLVYLVVSAAGHLNLVDRPMYAEPLSPGGPGVVATIDTADPKDGSLADWRDRAER